MSDEKISVNLGPGEVDITWDEPIADPKPKASKPEQKQKPQLVPTVEEINAHMAEAGEAMEKAILKAAHEQMSTGLTNQNNQNQEPSSDSLKLREKWLEEAFERLTRVSVKESCGIVGGVSCGYGKGGSRSNKGFSCHEDSTGASQIFIHPNITDKTEVISALSKAIQSVGLKTVAPEGVEAAMPPYPQHKLTDNDSKKDGIRQLKCFCPVCGYTARTSRKWIETGGAPFCPTPHPHPGMSAWVEGLYCTWTSPGLTVGGTALFRMIVEKDVKEEQSA